MNQQSKQCPECGGELKPLPAHLQRPGAGPDDYRCGRCNYPFPAVEARHRKARRPHKRKPLRMVIGPDDFRRLVAGEVATGDGVEVIFSDIGFQVMVAHILEAARCQGVDTLAGMSAPEIFTGSVDEVLARLLGRPFKVDGGGGGYDPHGQGSGKSG